MSGAERTYKYAGFISYSQKDQRWAKRIHRALERYRLPTGIAAGVAPKRRLGRFFRDDDELAGAPSLGSALEGALDDSRSLIVVCSPHAARSQWVDAEIRRFKSRGPDARVLAVIVDGQPDSDDPQAMCFAPSLLRRVGPDGELTTAADEPLAPDASKEPFNRLIARLVAGLLGLDFDTLWQRERRRIRNRRLLTAAGTAVALAGIVTAAVLLEQAEQERLREESVNLAARAQTALDDRRPDDALRLAVAALPRSLDKPERPLVPEAGIALQRVMHAHPAVGVLARLDNRIHSMHPAGDGLLAVQLATDRVSVIETATGELRHELEGVTTIAGGPEWPVAVSIHTEFGGEPLGHRHRVIVHDLASGERMRRLAVDGVEGTLTGPAVSSPDGSRVLHRSASRSNGSEEGLLLAVWAVPERQSAVLEVVAEGILRMPDHGATTAGFDARFVDRDTLILVHGETEKTIVRWDLKENAMETISRPTDAFPCPQVPAEPDDRPFARNDDVSVSPGRDRLAHARPTGDGGWCVRTWALPEGTALETTHVAHDSRTDHAAVMSESLFALANESVLSYAPLVLRDGRGDAVAFRHCNFWQEDMAVLAGQNRQWLVDPEAELTACVAGKLVQVHIGPHYNHRLALAGHQGHVTALAHDRATATLYSGDEDGVVRAWDLSNRPRVLDAAGAIRDVSTLGGRFALLHEDISGDSTLLARIFDADGIPVGTSFRHEPPADVSRHEAAHELEATLHLLANGRTMAIVENWVCGEMFRREPCPPEVRPRLILVDVETAEPLATIDGIIDGIGKGGIYRQLPSSIHMVSDRSRILVALDTGTVKEIDARTGSTLRGPIQVEGESVVAAVVTDDVLWLGTSDGIETDWRGQSRFTLYRIDADEDAVPVAVHSETARKLSLLPSPTGQRALFRFEPLGEPASYHLVDRDSGYRALDAGISGLISANLVSDVVYLADDAGAVLLHELSGRSPDAAGRPSVVIDFESGTAAPLGGRAPEHINPDWPVHDPAGRMLVTTRNFLGMLSLDGKEPPCHALAGQHVDSAAFSGDGAWLATASDSRGVTIHDLDTCTPVFSRVFNQSVRFSRLLFVEDTLWLLSQDGAGHGLRLERDLAKLHEQARKLIDRL